MKTVIRDDQGNIKYKVTNGTAYNVNTPDKVIYILEAARTSQTRIRVVCGDVETGRSWLETNFTTGTVGRSTGDIKIPLLILTTRSIGGDSILDHCIIKIVEAKSKRTLYKVDNYHTPDLSIKNSGSLMDEYPYMITGDGGEVLSRHKTLRSARILLNRLS